MSSRSRYRPWYRDVAGGRLLEPTESAPVTAAIESLKSLLVTETLYGRATAERLARIDRDDFEFRVNPWDLQRTLAESRR